MQTYVGGGAASFELAGIPVDFGSHRLHHGCDPTVLGNLRAMLGDDLLDRPRHDRIPMRGRSIHFPLRPLDLVARLPLSFTLGVANDTISKLLGQSAKWTGPETFASVLEAGLGRTICRDFYFLYARPLRICNVWRNGQLHLAERLAKCNKSRFRFCCRNSAELDTLKERLQVDPQCGEERMEFLLAL